MTFQDLVDELGLDTVFLNTSVDVATQNCILEWYFDYELADDDTTTWLRKFRRRVNDIYPRYKEEVRVMSIKSNMDPFITEFMQTVHNSSDTKNTTFTESNDGSKIIAYGKSSSYNDQDTFRPGSTEIETYNNITDTHNRGQNGIQTTTSYNNYHEDVTGGSSGTNTDTTAGDPYQTTGAVTNTGKGRAINIAYPEANMNSIGTGVDGGINDIGYASNETRNWSEDHLGATRMDQHLDQEVSTEYEDSNESHKTINGSQSVTETGTDTNTKTGNKTTTHEGSDVRAKTGSTANAGRDTTTTENDVSKTGAETNQGQSAEVYQGRHESAADILPRAIKAIMSSDPIKDLVLEIRVCFDCYARL